MSGTATLKCVQIVPHPSPVCIPVTVRRPHVPLRPRHWPHRQLYNVLNHPAGHEKRVDRSSSCFWRSLSFSEGKYARQKRFSKNSRTSLITNHNATLWQCQFGKLTRMLMDIFTQHEEDSYRPSIKEILETSGISKFIFLDRVKLFFQRSKSPLYVARFLRKPLGYVICSNLNLE